jgi:hypothetical protein
MKRNCSGRYLQCSKGGGSSDRRLFGSRWATTLLEDAE